MAIITIYNQAEDVTYKVWFEIRSTIINDDTNLNLTEYYLDVYTNLKKADGTAFPHYAVRELTDLPPGAAPVTTFTDLAKAYISYFIDISEVIESSSSSLDSSSSSVDSSSSSSSSS